jgi:MinD superfamily P-loop ATPase
MSYKIAIASGKGGTGKTSVAVNLLKAIYHEWTEKVQLIDCDVEEPNDLLFFSDFKRETSVVVNQFVPEIDTEKCTFCGRCTEYCEFNAIVMMPSVKFAKVNPDMCHSCGACMIACRDSAIEAKAYPIGKKSNFTSDFGASLKEGNLRVGSPMQTRLIKEVKTDVDASADLLIFDAPPGTSCPVVETVSDADYVVLVTEPTPFGLHDLKLTVALMHEMNRKFGVIINKAGLGNNDVYDYLKQNKIDLLCEIPFNKDYAALYAKGKLLEVIPESIQKIYSELVMNLKSTLQS